MGYTSASTGRTIIYKYLNKGWVTALVVAKLKREEPVTLWFTKGQSRLWLHNTSKHVHAIVQYPKPPCAWPVPFTISSSATHDAYFYRRTVLSTVLRGAHMTSFIQTPMPWGRCWMISHSWQRSDTKILKPHHESLLDQQQQFERGNGNAFWCTNGGNQPRPGGRIPTLGGSSSLPRLPGRPVVLWPERLVLQVERLRLWSPPSLQARP